MKKIYILPQFETLAYESSEGDAEHRHLCVAL